MIEFENKFTISSTREIDLVTEQKRADNEILNNNINDTKINNNSLKIFIFFNFLIVFLNISIIIFTWCKVFNQSKEYKYNDNNNTVTLDLEKFKKVEIIVYKFN